MGSEWSTEKIGKIAVTNTDTYSPKEEWEFVNYLDTGNITEGNISSIKRISDMNSLPSRARRKVQAGDIVYSTVRPNQKHYGIITEPAENMLVSTGFAVIRGITEKCNSKYLYYFLTQKHIVNHLHALAEQSTSAYPSIRPTDIGTLTIHLPPISDQRSIAHILGTLDDKIELNRKMNEMLEAMAQALFKSWFVDFDPVIDNALAAGNKIPEELSHRVEIRKSLGDKRKPLPEHIAKLFPREFEQSELGWIPKGLKVGSIGSEFNLTMGLSPPGITYNEDRIGLPFFQGNRDFGFRYPKNRIYCSDSKRIAEIDDTLISVRAPVGAINMAKELCCIGRGVASLRHNTNSRSYTYYTIQSLTNQFKRYDTEGTVFGAINKKQFERMNLIVPPDAVVNTYEELTFSWDQRININSKSSEILAQLRDTILPKLLSGELLAPDAEKYIEEVDA